VKFPEPKKGWGTSADDWHVAVKSVTWGDQGAASEYLSQAKEVFQKQRAE
jgi:hypothetical protein